MVVLIIILVLCVVYVLMLRSPTIICYKQKWSEPYLLGTAQAGFQNETSDMPPSQWKSFVKDMYQNITSPDHLNLKILKRDVNMLKNMGANCYRFSVEWSRVQQGVNEFDLSYYHSVCNMLKTEAIRPVVTLFHFVLPPWANDVWINKKRHFVRFAKRVVDELAKYNPIFITLNEPYLYALHGYMIGARPPFRKSTSLCLEVLAEMLANHVEIYNHTKRHHENCLVSIAKNVMPIHANTYLNPIEQALKVQFDNFFNRSYFRFINTGVVKFFLRGTYLQRRLSVGPVVDFFGVNHYTEMSLETQFSYRNPVEVQLRPPVISPGSTRSAAGWFVTPLSWYRTLDMVIANCDLPIIITECGVSNLEKGSAITRSDAMTHILSVIRTIPQVKGVMIWTLVDNIEWESGNSVRFGIFDIERRKTEIHEPIMNFFSSKN